MNDKLSMGGQDAIQRGKKFLLDGAKTFTSTTDTGLKVQDNFSQLLLYEATGNMDLVYIEDCERTWNYFKGQQHLITGDYPDDVDTTSLALLLLPVDQKLAHSVIDEILQLTTADGIVKTYFDQTRSRTDPFVCINVLRLLYHHGRGSEPALLPTKAWVHQVLIERTYLEGSRYYSSPDIFLFYLSQLLKANPELWLDKEISEALYSRVKERIGICGDAIEISMRLIACQSLGISNLPDRQQILASQCEDGGWGAGCLCRTGKKGIRIGNRGLATALAINALTTSSSSSSSSRT